MTWRRRRGGRRREGDITVTAPLRHKVLLDEDEMPTRWYNILRPADSSPAAAAPGTGQPVGPDDLSGIFPMDLIARGGVHRAVHRHPRGRSGRLPTCGVPLRCSGPTGSRRPSARPLASTTSTRGLASRLAQGPNTAVPQAYYNARAGIRKLTTETGAGQWEHLAGVRVRPVRPRVRDLAGAGTPTTPSLTARS